MIPKLILSFTISAFSTSTILSSGERRKAIKAMVHASVIIMLLFSSMKLYAQSAPVKDTIPVYKVLGSSGVNTASKDHINPDMPEEFLNERYGSEFRYLFLLPEGDYNVELGFAENWIKQKNERVFSVNLNGEAALIDLDIFQQAGYCKAITKSFQTSVKRGRLDIYFKSSKNQALINRIKITGKGVDILVHPGSPEDITAVGTTPDSPEIMNFDDKDGILKEGNFKGGMPLGGIGCGTFDINTNGTFGNITYNNNPDKPIEEVKGCLSAVQVTSAGKSQAFLLSTSTKWKNGEKLLPTVENITFQPSFPQVNIIYQQPDLPVRVSMRAYSSLIPHDIKNSSLPAACFLYTVKNESSGPVDVSIAMSWENISGVGGNTITSGYNFRDGALVKPIVPVDGYYGIEMKSATMKKPPDDRGAYNTLGNYTLLTQTTSSDIKVTTGCWKNNDKSIQWWDEFADKGTVSGPEFKWTWDSFPSGVVSARVTLKSQESREIPFVLAWYVPRHYTQSGMEYGHLYQKSFQDSMEVARYVMENRQNLAALTNEWQNRLRRSTLPVWFITQLINDVHTLFTNTILTRDSGIAGIKPGPSLFFSMSEPVIGGGVTGCPDLQIHNLALYEAFFPALNLLQLKQLALGQASTGSIAHYDGNNDYVLGGEKGADLPYSRTDWPDTSMCYIYQIFRHYLWSGDQKFMDEYYPTVKRAFLFLTTLDKDGDGIPEGSTTFDSLPQEGAFSYTASLWLATLRMTGQMALSMNDKTLISRVSELRKKTEFCVKSLLWKDNYLRNWAVPDFKDLPAGEGPMPSKRDDGSMFASLAGQWMTDSLDLEPIMPVEMINQEIDHLTTFNDTRWPILSSSIARTERWTDDRISYPQMSETFQASAYLMRGRKNEAYALMEKIHNTLYHFIQSPFNFSKSYSSENASISNRGDNIKHSSVTTPASWNFLYAIEGLKLNLPEGSISFQPQMPKGQTAISAPIFAPTFWGWMDYSITRDKSVLSFQLDRMTGQPSEGIIGILQNMQPLQSGANLVIKQIILPINPDNKAEVKAVLGRNSLPGKVVKDNIGRVIYRFESDVKMSAGQKMEFQW